LLFGARQQLRRSSNWLDLPPVRDCDFLGGYSLAICIGAGRDITRPRSAMRSGMPQLRLARLSI